MKKTGIKRTLVVMASLLITLSGCGKSKHDRPMPTADEQKAAADTETQRARDHIAKIEKKLGKNHPEAKALREEYGIHD